MKPMGFRLRLFCLVFLMLPACAPARFVRPLEQGERAVVFAAGGPLIGFGDLTIPVPVSSVTGGVGVSDRLTAFGSLYTTALLYGTLQTEIGAVHSFAEPSGWRPGFSVSPAANVAADVREWNVKVWPQADLHAYWSPAGRHLVYAGVSNWFELTRTRAHGEDQPEFWIANPQAGYVHRRGAWDYAAELKFLAPGIENTDVTVDYVSPGDRGAAGIYFGITRRF